MDLAPLFDLIRWPWIARRRFNAKNAATRAILKQTFELAYKEDVSADLLELINQARRSTGQI